MSGLNAETLRVPKTIKCFVDGKFIRTESGRSFPVYAYQSDRLYAHLSRASRKDLRNAVEAARKAQPGWSAKTAYNRSQILYRAAEMLEGKRTEFVELFRETLGYPEGQAQTAVDSGIDAFVYYAGFSDKFQQVVGAVNPVSGPHHNFTTPEAMGVVGFIASESFDFGELVAALSAMVCSGNTTVALVSGEASAVIGPLAEVFATSDFSSGVVNLLSGYVDELAQQFGTHMELEAVFYPGNNAELFGKLREWGVPNMKRVIGKTKESHSIDNILNFVEYKTVWHPVGS